MELGTLLVESLCVLKVTHRDFCQKIFLASVLFFNESGEKPFFDENFKQKIKYWKFPKRCIFVLYIPFGLLWIITTILSKPYEALVESAH
jgi:hypothetical protein